MPASEVSEFKKEVQDQLKYYVYRLIDPRNGETFYVGKGKGNRVFQHVRNELGADADVLTEKLQRINKQNPWFISGYFQRKQGLKRDILTGLLDSATL